MERNSSFLPKAQWVQKQIIRSPRIHRLIRLPIPATLRELGIDLNRLLELQYLSTVPFQWQSTSTEPDLSLGGILTEVSTFAQRLGMPTRLPSIEQAPDPRLAPLFDTLMKDLCRFVYVAEAIKSEGSKLFCLVMDPKPAKQLSKALEIVAQYTVRTFTVYNNGAFTKRLKAGLVRRAQLELIHLALQFVVCKLSMLLFQCAIDYEVIPTLVVKRRKNGQYEVVYNDSRLRRLSVFPYMHRRESAWWQGLDEFEDDMIRLVGFVVDLRSDSIETRILKYVKDEQK
ncbi:hypothetical protein BJ508DRAFT_309198 [Ascobolus immersus RN42]|uniref:Uncharacterized protein n=1 Tax=Ascobolus immersus RN42 TaxID=1160509 RepID=A0A3N4I2V9_ASCIM|nr:hypothetical protein BJ508DRAFT_309198 [Ascobolus immersus RN42]